MSGRNGKVEPVIPALEGRIGCQEKDILELKRQALLSQEEIDWLKQQIKDLTGNTYASKSMAIAIVADGQNPTNLQNSDRMGVFKNIEEGAFNGEAETVQNVNRPTENQLISGKCVIVQKVNLPIKYEAVGENKTIKVADALPEMEDVKEEVGFEAEDGPVEDFAPAVAGTDFLAKTMHRGRDTVNTAAEYKVDPISDRAKRLQGREVRGGDDTGSIDLSEALVMLVRSMLVVGIILALLQLGIVLSTGRTSGNMNDRLEWILKNSKHHEKVAIPKICRAYSTPYDEPLQVFILSYESAIKQDIVEVQSFSSVGP